MLGHSLMPRGEPLSDSGPARGKTPRPLPELGGGGGGRLGRG